MTRQAVILATEKGRVVRVSEPASIQSIKAGSPVVELTLYRTEKRDPVVTIQPTYAKEDDAGNLYFEGGAHMVMSYEEGDQTRYDREIAKHHIQTALWLAQRNSGKGAEKACKRLKKLLGLMGG